MPLNGQVTFKTRLQRGNKLQVPINVRTHYKLQTAEMLKVTINLQGVWSQPQTFLAKIRPDGRVDIPKVIMEALNTKNLPEKLLMGVTLQPP